MKILAIILKNEKANCKIEDSSIDVVEIEKGECEAKVLNTFLKTIDSKYTHVMLLPESSTVYATYTNIITGYLNDNTVLLPLINLNDEEGNFKGIINSSLWWPQLNPVIGKLELYSATQQVDTTLYGGLIPVEIFKEYQFEEGLNIYYQFEFLNHLTKDEREVIGVPKILSTIIFDYSLLNVEKEEKIKLFEKAREKYVENSKDNE